MVEIKTQELLENAQISLDSAQNQNWMDENKASSLGFMLLQDSQARSLLAIAKELKRFNDFFEEGFTVTEVSTQ